MIPDRVERLLAIGWDCISWTHCQGENGLKDASKLLLVSWLLEPLLKRKCNYRLPMEINLWSKLDTPVTENLTIMQQFMLSDHEHLNPVLEKQDIDF